MPAFRHAMRVAFDDVDYARILYYPRYFHYFHLAFEHYLNERFAAEGGYVALLDARRIGFPAVHAEADYKRPLTFGDRIVVELRTTRVGDKSVTLEYAVLVADTGEVACEGKVIAVVTDLGTFKSTAMPADIRAAFDALA